MRHNKEHIRRVRNTFRVRNERKTAGEANRGCDTD